MAGYKRVTEAGYVASTNPVKVYAVNMASAGGDAIQLQDGEGGTEIITHNFTGDTEVLTFPYGLTFKSGCYVASVGDGVTLVYERI